MELDIMAIIQQYAVLPVAVLCLGLGWLLKHTFETFPDKYIPAALLVPALVLTLWVNNWAVTFENVMSAACSAAMAVYLHQNGKQLLSKNE